jgi:hypothetical protein
MSNAELERIIPVTPPIVNNVINPINQHRVTLFSMFTRIPKTLESHLKILIPVGIPITIVAPVKYARLSTSIPIVYI